MPNGWHRKVNDEAARERKKQYNSTEYKHRRAQGQRQVDAGIASCWRCGRHLPPGKPWHLGHDDHNRAIIRGPECPPCNLHAAASKGARVANARRKAGLPSRTVATVRRTSRHW